MEEIIPLSDTRSTLAVANVDEILNFNGDKATIMKIISETGWNSAFFRFVNFVT